MAGLLSVITETQLPRVSRYTCDLLDRARRQHGEDSGPYRGIYNQYFRMPTRTVSAGQNTRHFDALMSDETPRGLERLYRRVVVIDLLSACASECVFCVRGLYDPHTLNGSQILRVAEYLRDEPDLREVLVTGGDPFVTPQRLGDLVQQIAAHAPNITTVRVGTRLPVQDPYRVNAELYALFDQFRERFMFEVAIQINHPFELQPETVEVIRSLQRAGVRLYSQNVLLKGVNDSLPTLVELYDELRSLRLVPYYFYHAVPMVGMDEFRTSVQRGLSLTRELTTSGMLSGMAKPMFTIMTDIGKVTLYDGSILPAREPGRLRISTSYRLEDRRRWNPGYRLPATAAENSRGTLDVTYVDGDD